MKWIKNKFFYLIFCVFFLELSYAQELRIIHFDVGQGDAALIISPTGKTMLVDVGEERWNETKNADNIADYLLNELGDTLIDYLVVSHYHTDHLGSIGKGGIWYLLEKKGIKIDKTIDRGFSPKSHDAFSSNTQVYHKYKSWAQAAGANKINRETAEIGNSQIDLGGGVVVKIVSFNCNGQIAEPEKASENDFSVAFKLSFGEFDEFFGGDLSGVEHGRYHDCESGIAEDVEDIEVYKVNHHGSAYSSNKLFISRIDPEVAIISAGESSHKHPREEVVKRLLLHPTIIYQTHGSNGYQDEKIKVINGNIEIRTSGVGFTVNGDEYTTEK